MALYMLVGTSPAKLVVGRAQIGASRRCTRPSINNNAAKPLTLGERLGGIKP